MSDSCDLMDSIQQGFCIHGIFQARIVEWAVISYSRASSWPRDQTRISWVSCISWQILYHCMLGKPTRYCTIRLKFLSLFFVGFFFLVYYLSENYSKSITVQYSTIKLTVLVEYLGCLTYEQIGWTCSQADLIGDLLHICMLLLLSGFSCVRLCATP